ncbi:MAG: hypothetical protein G01um101433_975 [Parcubacteria group bacterium Gr01-1014_33]|nr:MAG: hypothetical protein G01um101433_975 [Parcubacteria group bacterium Gr01-1014_33]
MICQYSKARRYPFEEETKCTCTEVVEVSFHSCLYSIRHRQGIVIHKPNCRNGLELNVQTAQALSLCHGAYWHENTCYKEEDVNPAGLILFKIITDRLPSEIRETGIRPVAGGPFLYRPESRSVSRDFFPRYSRKERICLYAEKYIPSDWIYSYQDYGASSDYVAWRPIYHRDAANSEYNGCFNTPLYENLKRYL